MSAAPVDQRASDEQRAARAGLSRLAEPGDREVGALVVEHGPQEALARLVAGHGRLARFSARVAVWDPERDLANAERVGARVVVPGDDEWPTGLDDLAVPPWCLWVRGPAHLARGVRRSVSVVGARAATAYGEHLASDLAAGLAQRGWTVVSGAAFGIDAAAHRGVLAVDGRTIACLAGGVERAYPAAHAALLERVLVDGAVLSEVPPGAAPMRSRFLARNRVIAALTAGTVVVEAGLRSGSLSTARHAAELGRHVAVVPGPVTSAVSAGCHEAVRSGLAVLVTSAEEVVELVGDLGADACEEPRGEERPGDDLDEREARVLDALPASRPVDLDTVAVLAALDPRSARSALARLEDAGLAHGEGGLWRKAPASRG